jgi:hypothetical protein
MADEIDWSSVGPPSPPTQMSKLPGWATGMALGQVMGEGFIEEEAWVDFIGGDEKMAEGVTAMFQHFMSQLMSSLGSSADFLKEMDDDEDNPAKGLLPT